MKGGEKMRVHLLNSAVMPVEGTYRSKKIPVDIFKSILAQAYENGQLLNYIGYETNIKLIAEWCDIRLPLSRDEVQLKDGDILLVMKLKYRLKDVKMKTDSAYQKQLSENDFEFFVVEYEKT
jgi:hypothetical protein